MAAAGGRVGVVTWERALCRTRPADWWSTGDDGNRLALAVCSVCPTLPQCPAGDPSPHGVIRGGVAWSNHGERLPLCPCGRPTPTVERVDCFTCRPDKDTPMPSSLLNRPAEPFAATIRTLLAEGWTYRSIGLRIGSQPEAVRSVARRHGWKSKLAGRPQAVSTGDAA